MNPTEVPERPHPWPQPSPATDCRGAFPPQWERQVAQAGSPPGALRYSLKEFVVAAKPEPPLCATLFVSPLTEETRPRESGPPAQRQCGRRQVEFTPGAAQRHSTGCYLVPQRDTFGKGKGCLKWGSLRAHPWMRIRGQPINEGRAPRGNSLYRKVLAAA